ncbi:transglutaminase-like domain-containing protein [Rugosimonospora acidiphila]|uniref:Transglutaminase-like domain-containing protein n=1 Tax=Rugosimonospora acidiphila TaxID=556531 RepID=A0ABP9S1B8_9ACTN
MDEREFYRGQSRVTDPGSWRSLLRDLPRDLPGMGEVIEGVIVHRDETRRFGFELPAERRDEANTRYLEAILGRLGSLSWRPPRDRFAGTCRDFAVLLCAMLREAGVPARVRCGFAGYFAEGFFDDHWVVEVHDDDGDGGGIGWRLVDAQLIASAKDTYRIDFDPMDVPRDAFLVAGDAWLACREGRRDPERIGTSAAGLTGMWEIQGSVVRDLANLNGIETLPWDGWGLIPTHYDELDRSDVDLLDRVAAVSAAGGPLPRAAEAYRSDPRLAVPAPFAG